MTQELRPDGATDTSYYTRDTGRRLNSLAAVLRYLRVRLSAHTHTHIRPRPPPGASRWGALPPVQSVQGGCREWRSRGCRGRGLARWIGRVSGWRCWGGGARMGLAGSQGWDRGGGAVVPNRCRCD